LPAKFLVSVAGGSGYDTIIEKIEKAQGEYPLCLLVSQNMKFIIPPAEIQPERERIKKKRAEIHIQP